MVSQSVANSPMIVAVGTPIPTQVYRFARHGMFAKDTVDIELRFFYCHGAKVTAEAQKKQTPPERGFAFKTTNIIAIPTDLWA